MSRLGTAATQGRETLDGARKEIAQSRQESARHRPAPPEAGLVLDVGSGPAAEARADVRVDADVLDTTKAPAEAAAATSPLIVADPRHLPFTDAAFAYVIASDVLAITSEPGKAAEELARVAPRGFVQVPTRAALLVYGGPLYRWYVDDEDGTLVFSPKESEPAGAADARAAFDESLLVRLGWGAHRSRWEHSVEWEGAPAVRADGEPGGEEPAPLDVERTLAFLEDENRHGRLAFMAPAILGLLRCPACGDELSRRGRWMDSAGCGTSYPVVGPVPVLLAAASRPSA